jgi:hypothetical protein
VGAFGGYETFDYSSTTLAGRLTGDGWRLGGYFGWRFMSGWRLDLGAACSGVNFDAASGAGKATFLGSRWMVSAGLVGARHRGLQAGWASGSRVSAAAEVGGLGSGQFTTWTFRGRFSHPF